MEVNVNVELELLLVLPSVNDAGDGCIDRLIDALSARWGIDRVHAQEARG